MKVEINLFPGETYAEVIKVQHFEDAQTYILNNISHGIRYHMGTRVTREVWFTKYGESLTLEELVKKVGA